MKLFEVSWNICACLRRWRADKHEALLRCSLCDLQAEKRVEAHSFGYQTTISTQLGTAARMLALFSVQLCWSWSRSVQLQQQHARRHISRLLVLNPKERLCCRFGAAGTVGHDSVAYTAPVPMNSFWRYRSKDLQERGWNPFPARWSIPCSAARTLQMKAMGFRASYTDVLFSLFASHTYHSNTLHRLGVHVQINLPPTQTNRTSAPHTWPPSWLTQTKHSRRAK